MAWLAQKSVFSLTGFVDGGYLVHISFAHQDVVSDAAKGASGDWGNDSSPYNAILNQECVYCCRVYTYCLSVSRRHHPKDI
jgi:hypothetical protein